MEKLTTREKQVLKELVKNSKVSDQEIARKLKTSRPTIYKIRQRLEEREVIKQYSVKTDFKKMDFNVHAVIMYRWKDYSKSEELKQILDFIVSLPEVILFIKGEGMGSKTDLIISIHKDLIEYETFIRRLKYQWKDNVENVEVFLSSIEGMFKNYDLSGPVLNRIQEKVIQAK
jgi:DNA-binding Lrp family transcriptional regulator